MFNITLDQLVLSTEELLTPTCSAAPATIQIGGSGERGGKAFGVH